MKSDLTAPPSAPVTTAVDRGARLELLAAILITAALGALHLFLLFNRGPLWRDEISSLVLATRPTLHDLWAGLALDPAPVLFFVLLRFWHLLVGDNDLALRILGTLIGLSCLAALWTCARLFGRKAPTLSLLLLAAFPTMIVWGDSLRAYGLGVAWIVLSFALFWKVIECPSLWQAAAATVAAICSVHSLYTNALLIFACGTAAACVAARRRHWMRAGLVLTIGGIAALSLLPYLGLWHQMGVWADVLRVDFSLANSFGMLEFGLLGTRHHVLWLWIALFAAAIVLAVWMQRRDAFGGRLAEQKDAAAYALLASIIGLVSTMAFFRAVGWGTNVWYYLPMLAIIAVAIDLIIDLRGIFAFARAALGVIGVAAAMPLLLKAVDTRATNIDLVARTIAKYAQPEDLAIVQPVVDGITFKRYFRGEVDWLTVPVFKNLPALHADDFMDTLRQPNAIQPIIDKIDRTLQAGHDVWVATSWPLEAPKEVPPPVQPLSETNRGTMGYFLRGWGYQFVYELREHSKHVHAIEVRVDQPVSIYERSVLMKFSGWRETSQDPPPAESAGE